MVNELTGGLKNALEHGSSLDKAKKSFLNAGYKAEEVDAAVNELSGVGMSASSAPMAPTAPPQPQVPGPDQSLELLTGAQKVPAPKTHFSGILILILVLLILGIAAALGIYWDTILKMFKFSLPLI